MYTVSINFVRIAVATKFVGTLSRLRLATLCTPSPSVSAPLLGYSRCFKADLDAVKKVNLFNK